VIRLRNRLFPYGRLIFLAIWMFLLFLIATNIQAGWLYVVISFLLMLGLLSRIIPPVSLRGVSARAALPELCERGTTNTGAVFLENNSRYTKYMIHADLPGGGPLAFDPPRVFAARLAPGAKAAFPVRFVPALRGRAGLDAIEAGAGSPVGLFVRKKKLPSGAETLVYPVISAAEGEALAAAAGADDSARGEKFFAVEDPYHYKIREYVPGESLRRIHWKLTAKRGEPMIRINERKIFGHSGILVDNLRENYPAGGEFQFEQVLEKAISLAFHLVFVRGLSVTIAGTAAPEIAVDSKESWEHALRWFALIRLENAPRGPDRSVYGRSEFEGFLIGPAGEAPA
jgi:uncharacterized protein (DUF58 family)